MKTLVKLRLVQGRGTLRHLFAKPLSAVITLLVAALYGTILIPLFLHAGEAPISGTAAHNMLLGIVGFGLMLAVSTLVQNKRSLFFAGDAHYLYTGPFARRKILALYAFDNAISSVLFALLSLMPVMYGAASASVPTALILTAFLAMALAQYGLLTLNGILYLRELSSPKAGGGNWVVLGLLAACTVGVGAAAFFAHRVAGGVNFAALVAGPQLNWLPFFGWARMAMTGVLQGSLPMAAAGAVLLLVAAGVATAVLLGHKGDFYERSMADAEAYTDYYKKARTGQSAGDGKVRSVSVAFGKGPQAILSKNLLLALKGRELLRLQDFLVIAMYLAMAFFTKMDFTAYAVMLMVWMLIMAGNSSLVDDLQHHYVYLIPGGPVKKLFCTLAVPLAKTALVLAASLVLGGLLLGESLAGIAGGVLVCLAVLLVITAGNVLSLRLLKSRSNKMVEQALRMILAVISLLPGLAVFLLLQVASGGAAAGLAGPVFAGFSAAFAVAVLLFCAPMMRGNELNTD